MAENRTVKVTLKAEVASYVASVLRAQQATDSLGGSASKAGSDVERALAQAEKSAQSSTQAFDNLGKVTKRTLAGMALVLGGYGAALLHQGVQANSSREQNQIALASMLGDAKAAKAALDEVYGLATDTPFQFPVLSDQYKTLVSTRMELDKIVPLMRAYSGAVAAGGGDNAKLQQVADVFSKIQTLGKAGAEEINSLALAQIPAWDYMARAAGTSIDEVRKQVTANMWDSTRTIAVLTAGMEEQYGGMLDGMADSYARWEDKVASAQRRTAEQLAVPVQEVGKEVMRSLTGLFNEVTASLSGQDIWDPIIEPLMAIPETIDRISQRVSSGGAQDIINGVGEGLALLAAAGELVVNVGLPLIDVLTMAARAGMPLITLTTALLEGFNQLPAPVQASIAALALISTLHGPYSKLITTVTGVVPTVKAAMAQQMAYGQVLREQAALDGMALGSTTRLGSAYVGLTSRLQMLTAASRGAGSAVVAALGGPAGIAVAAALAAVTLATGNWTDAQQQAEEAARAQEAAVDSLTGSLDRNTGAIGENAREHIAMALDRQGLPDLLQGMGVSVDEFTDSLYGSTDQQEAFRQKLIEAANTPQFREYMKALGQDVSDTDALVEKFSKKALSVQNGDTGGFLGMGLEADELKRFTGEGYSALAMLGVFDAQLAVNAASLKQFRDRAALAGREVNINGTVSVDTSQATSALQALQQSASKALASFLTLSPQKKRSGGGGGGGGSGDSPAVKALKSEQKEIKKRTDAEKKAATEYEKILRKRAQEAEKTAREAEKAAADAASAEEAALDKSARAVDDYVSAQRQRAAIERTLAAENDPVRRAQLQQALTDALAHEAAMLAAKTAAEREAAAATGQNREAQERATSSLGNASKAQADLETASERSALVQERAAAQVEAAAERLATATENASSRAGGAMSGAADEAKESLREWIDRMKEQVRAQSEWADNMVWLAGVASAGVVGMFADLGAEGAYLLAEFRKSGGAELGALEAIAGNAADRTYSNLIDSAVKLEQVYPALVQRFGQKAADELRASVYKGTTDVDQMLKTLKATQEGQTWRLNIDANTYSAVQAAGGLVNYIQNLKPKMKVMLEGTAMKLGNKYIYPGMSEGGPVLGPGQKGKDSEVRVLAPGEHVLTAGDVDAMGGQGAVSAFRRSLHNSPPDISRAAASGSGGGGGPRTVIHQTVYYPVAEPSSTAAIRADRREVG